VKEVTIASRAAKLKSAHRHVRHALAKSDPLWRALANRLERTEHQQNGVASSKAIVRDWPHR
jgi:ribosomal protein L18E